MAEETGQRPRLLGIETYPTTGENLSLEEIKKRETFGLILASQELAYLTYLARAGDDRYQRRTQLQDYWNQVHPPREERMLAAGLKKLTENPDITLLFYIVGDAHARNEFRKLFNGFEQRGLHVQAYVLSEANAGEFLLAKAVLGNTMLNPDNSYNWYSLYYERGKGIDPYLGDYVGAHGPEYDELGRKYNYPHPRDFTPQRADDFARLEQAFVDHAFRTIGQDKEVGRLIFRYFHSQEFRDFYRDNIPVD
jgi:hypothetical protein